MPDRVRRARSVVAAALLATAAATAPAPAGEAPAQAATVLTVDVTRPLGPTNRALVGFGWHEGGAPLHAVEALDPHLVRIDASLQDISTSRDGPLRLQPLLDRVAAARAIGAEPLVILSYLPAWLGEERAGGRDPTRVAPSDLDAWQQLVHDVVLALATAPAPARRFEAWNEPDVPLFWQDTPSAWVDTVERSARAVAAVEEEVGVDLAFIGPATAFPDPVYLEPFLVRFRDTTLPLDGVSWHYYGNYPFFGPDGAEFPVTEPIQPILGRENPLASPASYGHQIELMRQWVDAGLAGSGRVSPPLMLDEWNLSAAGYDDRHDTNEGAAFAAATLVEMQEAALDAAAFFRANDTRGVAGEHGAVMVDGTRKPSWWAFWLWQRLAPTQVAVDGTSDTDGLWAVAATGDGAVTVLVSSFSASNPRSRTVELDVTGLSIPPTTAAVRRLDATHSTAETPEPLAVTGSTVRVELPEQAVALVELEVPAPPQEPMPTPASTAAADSVRELPATGAGGHGAVGIAAGAALAALLLQRARRAVGRAAR